MAQDYVEASADEPGDVPKLESIPRQTNTKKRRRPHLPGRSTASLHGVDDGEGEGHGLAMPDPIDSRRVYTRGRYRTSQISVLTARYARIRGDLMVSAHGIELHSDDVRSRHAELCRDELRESKAELERRRPKLPVSASLLSLADRELVSLYPDEVLGYRLQSAVGQLSEMKPVPTAQLDRIRPLTEDASPEPANLDRLRRTALRDALEYIHGCDERALIEDDLQVTRLRSLMLYVFIAWLALVVAVPFVTTVQVDSENVVWPVWNAGSDFVDLLAAAVALSVVGAVGGVISGMFRVRDSRAVLGEYRTSMLKLALKPLVGAVAAVTLYLFLSAKVIAGVNVTNAGVYIVAAFLAGFSERYFLRVLRAQEDTTSPVDLAKHSSVSLPSRGGTSNFPA